MNRGRGGTARGGARAAAPGSGTTASRPASVSASATPTPTSTTTSRGVTPASGRRGAGASSSSSTAPVGRFRPKVIRRDEAERDTLARQEEQKANERAAEERRALRGRGRGRSQRSRGDAMGRGGMRGVGAASGPFSSGIAGGRSGGGWFGGGGAGGSAGSGFRAGGMSRGTKSEKGGFHQTGDRGNRETRINADKLHVMTADEELDSDDEAMMHALSNKASSVLPMGIYRREHKDEGVVVVTNAELEAAEKAAAAVATAPEEGGMFVDDDDDDDEGTPDRPIPQQPPEEGIWDTGDKKPATIKKEMDDDSAMDLDAKFGVSEQQEKKPIPTKKTVPVEPEDKIMQSDLDMLANELGSVIITNEDGETKTQGPPNKDGRLYLFQFPPLLPPLNQTLAPQQKNKVTIKGEPQEEDFNMLDAPPAPTVDLTSDEHPHQQQKQQDENNDNNNKDDNDPQSKKGFMSSLLSTGGMIGHLRVRKSGRVELDWGGRTTLEMCPATGLNFLTTAVILEENDEKPATGVIGGDSIGMGKIMGRFVLAPTWEEEEEWVVGEEELVVTEELQAREDARVYHKNLK